MVELSFYQMKIEQSKARIAELKQTFLSFSIPDDNFIFVVDPDSREYLAPFIAEVGKWQEYNLSVLKSIQDAKSFCVGTQENIAEVEIPDRITSAYTERIRSLTGQINSFMAQLGRLKTIDPVTLETIIPAEKKQQADEFKKSITVDIPARIETMHQEQQKIKALFEGLDTVIPAPGENLPKR
jgi:hypothetical protein